MEVVSRYRCGFYFEQLSIDQQLEYRKIASAISYYEPAVQTEDSEQSVHKIKLAVQYDNPEFFYWSQDDSKLNDGKLQLKYMTESREEALELVKMAREKRQCILADLSEEGNMSQEEMLARVYDYLVKTVKYADDELQKPACAPWIYSIQGPLLKERGACLGIALTVNYMCLPLHIPSILITGEAKVAGWTGNHGWNLVAIGESYSHLDVTSEICDGNTDKGRKYYLKSDMELEDRKWPRTLYPKAV